MKKQVIENFNEWIFEAAAPKKPAATVIPGGYSKSILPKKTTESTVDVMKKASGWTALMNDDSLQVSDLKNVGTGMASDKVEDFKGKGELVMGPVIYGNPDGTSFVVGFPFSKPDLTSTDIYLTDKYLLFAPFNGSTPSFTQEGTSKTGAGASKPTNARLVAKDKPFLVGLQSLMWILGFNNSAAATKFFASMLKEDMLKALKAGMESLSKVTSISGTNDAAAIISEGYNAILSEKNAADIFFNNFAAGSKKITPADIQKELGLKAKVS